jgi:hypothetical protein
MNRHEPKTIEFATIPNRGGFWRIVLRGYFSGNKFAQRN